MTYYDPSFEARRKQIIGGSTTPSVSNPVTSGYSDPNFEARRIQVITAPVSKPKQVSQPTTIISQPTSQNPLISTATNIFSSLGGLVKNAGNLIDSVFKKQELISPIPESQIIKEKKPSLISKVSKTVSTLNDKLGPILFSLGPVPTEYQEPSTMIPTPKKAEKLTAGKYIGGMIDDALMAFVPAGGVSISGGRNILKEGLNITKGIKTAAVFAGLQGLISTLKEEKVSIPSLLVSGGFGFLLGSFEPQVMAGFPKQDISQAKNLLRDYGIKPSEFTNPEILKTKFRSIVKTLHPDVGGDPKEFKTFIEAYNKVTSAGIDAKWTPEDISSWITNLWDKRGQNAEDLYKQANSTFRSFMEKIVGSKEKSVELSPKSVFDIVVGSDLQKTELGKILLKSSLMANQTGKNVSVIQVGDTTTGETVAKTPQGINVGVRLVNPTANADKPPVSPVVTPTKETVTENKQVAKAIQTTEPYFQSQDKYVKPEDFIKESFGVKPESSFGFLEADKIIPRDLDKIDMKGVEEYKTKILNGEKIEPVIVTLNKDGKLETTDGTHRVVAYKELGLKVPTIITGQKSYPGTTLLSDMVKKASEIKPSEVVKIEKQDKNIRITKKPLTKSSREKIQTKLSEQIYQSETQEKAIKAIDSFVEKSLRSKNNKELKAVRAELSRQMYQIAGADSGNYKKDYAILQHLRHEPEIEPILDKIEAKIDQIDRSLLSKKVEESYGFNPTNLEDPQSETAVKETDKIVKRSEIAKTLSEKLGVPIRRGKFRRQALGIFKPSPKVVRIKRGGLQTVFHEVGHFIDDKFELSKNISTKERTALMTEYGIKYEGNPKRQQQEALAEFLRFKMTGQDSKVHNFAPEFSKTWDKIMEGLPEIKDVIDTATKDFKRWNDQPATAKILSHISIGTQDKMSLSDRATSSLHTLYTSALDDLHPLAEFSKLAKKQLGVIPSEKDPYILARNLRGWTGKAELFLNKGTFGKKFWTVDEKGKSHMNFNGLSYTDIIKPIEKSGKLDEFRVYIVAKRAIELADRNIITGITKKDAMEALKELGEKNPEFEKASAERIKYKDRLLEYASDPSSGVLGPEGLARIKELNKFHVPFYRVMEETQGAKFMGRRKIGGNLSSPIKKIKGSEREIIDPLESDIKDTYAIINAVERNSIGIAMANLASENFELGRLFEKVDRPMKGMKVNAKEVLDKVMKESGGDLEMPEEMADLAVTIFRPTQDRGPNMLNLNMGDKQMVFQVDPDLFNAIQGLNTEDAGVIMRILSMPSKLLRAGATLTPDFSLRNPLRDQFSAFTYSNYGFVPGLDLVRGMFEVFKKGDVYDLWKAGGGEHAMMVSMDREILQQNFKDLFKGKLSNTIDYVKHPLHLLQVISELGEQATRLGEMKRGLESGASPIESAHSSREVTLDFARIGSKTKAINLLVAFWNANVQGSDKLVRSFKNNPFRTLFKVLLGITLPSILLYMANRDDKRWKEIPAWQKDLFWIVFTKDHIIRIPKPFEVGILFGSVPERVLEFLDTKNPEIFKQLQSDVANGATPGFIPTTLLPIIENISNYSFFLDRPIVSEGKQGLPPEAQANTYTTEISKLIGKTLGYSPAKVDNLIQGYSGGLGRYATQIIDKVLIGTGVAKPASKPAPALEDLPIIKAFMIREPVGSSSESVNKIYTMYGQIGGQVSYVRNLVKENNIDEAKKYIKQHPEIINIGTINGAVSVFSDLNKARNIIMNDKKLTPEQKKLRIKKIDEAETNIAQRVLKQLEK